MSKKNNNLTRCGNTMTEAAYLAWIRSALRSKSLRWPPRNKALELARRPHTGPNKQQKWEYVCALCGKWQKMKDVCVDHYPVAAGAIRSVEDIGQFANNLYCEVDNLRVLCKEPCHAVHTLAESEGISFDEAKILKEVIRLLKKENRKEMLDLLHQAGVQCRNDEQRRAALTKILKEKMWNTNLQVQQAV